MSATTEDSVPLQSRAAAAADRIDAGSERERLVRLMQDNYGVLLRLIRGRIGNRELAEDLLNEAFAIALERLRLGKLAEPSKVAGFVFRVSMNLLRNHRRNLDNRAVRSDALVFEQLIAPDEPEDVDDPRLKLLAQEMLDSLHSRRDQEIVTRFYLYEHAKEAICRDFGLTSVRFNLVISRARQRMKKLLAAKGLTRADLLCIVLATSFLLVRDLIAVFALPHRLASDSEAILAKRPCTDAPHSSQGDLA